MLAVLYVAKHVNECRVFKPVDQMRTEVLWPKRGMGRQQDKKRSGCDLRGNVEVADECKKNPFRHGRSQSLYAFLVWDRQN